MTKKYFDTPSLVLVKMQSNDIVTTSNYDRPGNQDVHAPIHSAPGRRTIWD